MDGFMLNIIATVVTVGVGSISVYAGLRNRIDNARDAANEANTQIKDFTRFCDERHKALDKIIDKLEDR